MIVVAATNERAGELHDQHLGLWNFRAVKAVTATGVPLRERMLLRSEHPYHLAPEERTRLVGVLGIRQILDRRTPEERRADESIEVPVVRLTLPDVSRDEELLAGRRQLADAYLEILESHGPTLAEAVRVLSGAGPTLVHCTAGKDRTGIVVALTLSVVGARVRDIVDDYRRSEQNLRRLQAERRRAGVEPSWSHLPAALLSSPPEAIEAVLAATEQRWGSTYRYLEHHGFGASDAERLHHLLLTPRPTS